MRWVSGLHMSLRVCGRCHRPDSGTRVLWSGLVGGGDVGGTMGMLAVRLLILRRVFHSEVTVVLASTRSVKLIG